MGPLPAFSYDLSEVPQGYAAARCLSPHAQATWAAAIAGIVPASLGPIRTILDAGCGTGRFSALLAASFEAQVLGIDPSEKMLAQACSGPSDPRCTFLPGALESIPVENRSVDLVFLSMVFHHIRNWGAALQQLRRVLRPGGVVLIRTALKETMAKHLWAQFFPTAHAIDLRRMPSADDVVARMGSGHFKLVTHRTVAHRFADDAKSYVAKIRLRGLSALQMIPETEFCRGIDLLERHLRTVPTNASSFTEDMDLFCFAKPLVDP